MMIIFLLLPWIRRDSFITALAAVPGVMFYPCDGKREYDF